MRKPNTFGKIAGATAVAITIFALACGVTPPFNSYDPPPTFAIHYTLQNNSNVYYPGAFGSGSTLSGVYFLDVVGGSFVTSGTTRAFGPNWVPFGSYYTVSGGRWPARWNVTSTDGCGAGTGSELDVESKLPELTCIVETGSMTVQPNLYGITVPLSLKLAFNTAQVPAGTAAQSYVVGSTNGEVYQEQDITTDSTGHATINTPDLPNGKFYVVGDFKGLSQEYGTQATLTRSCPNGYCP